jgi:hypothetical protein
MLFKTIQQLVDHHCELDSTEVLPLFCLEKDLYNWLEKDSYVIENDLYIKIWWLRLILYDRFF